LRELYGEIYIPRAVYQEVTALQDKASDSLKCNIEWIHVSSVQDDSQRKMYRAKLHAGEVEVMMMAQEMQGDVLTILDDNEAKKTAKYLGLRVTGTLGVLLKAKECGFLQEIAPLMRDMENNGFFISTDIKEMVLEVAKEK